MNEDIFTAPYTKKVLVTFLMVFHRFVPYCSSDSWSGTHRAADGSGEFSFMGSVIVEEVVEALVALNFTHGHKLILAGSR